MLHDGLQVDEKCTQIRPDISELSNIFPLHMKTKIYTKYDI
jgi:hypothetical protein